MRTIIRRFAYVLVLLAIPVFNQGCAQDLRPAGQQAVSSTIAAKKPACRDRLGWPRVP